MNANAEKKVITVTYTQNRTKMDSYEDGKNGFYPLKEKTTDSTLFFFFAKMTDSALFPSVRQKMANRSLWDKVQARGKFRVRGQLGRFRRLRRTVNLCSSAKLAGIFCRIQPKRCHFCGEQLSFFWDRQLHV